MWKVVTEANMPKEWRKESPQKKLCVTKTEQRWKQAESVNVQESQEM